MGDKRNKKKQKLLIKPVFSKNLNKAALIWPHFNNYLTIKISYSYLSYNYYLSSTYTPQCMMT